MNIEIVRRPKLLPRQSENTIKKNTHVSIRYRRRTKWTKEEDEKLLKLVLKNGENWELIRKELGYKYTELQCSNHWKLSLNPTIKKGNFTK